MIIPTALIIFLYCINLLFIYESTIYLLSVNFNIDFLCGIKLFSFNLFVYFCIQYF